VFWALLGCRGKFCHFAGKHLFNVFLMVSIQNDDVICEFTDQLQCALCPFVDFGDYRQLLPLRGSSPLNVINQKTVSLRLPHRPRCRTFRCIRLMGHRLAVGTGIDPV
jgi:hypothetical protein